MIAGVVMSDYPRVFHLLDRLIIFWHLIRVNQSQFIYVCKSLKWIFMLYVEYQFMQEQILPRSNHRLPHFPPTGIPPSLLPLHRLHFSSILAIFLLIFIIPTFIA